MKPFSYYFYNYFYRVFLLLYLRFNTRVKTNGLRLVVYKGVFHPSFFFSSGLFFNFLKAQDLNGKKFLEIGCGSGLLCLLAAKKGARVTGVDISKTAVENTRVNFKRNFGVTSAASILESNLFSALNNEIYDVIAVNPPYYFKDPQHESQFAWYCGAEGEYFHGLFSQLGKHTHSGSKTWMILAETCDLSRISALAERYGFSLVIVHEQKVRWEKNYIYSIQASKKAG